MAKTELKEKLEEQWKIFEDTMWEVALAHNFRPEFNEMLNFLTAVGVILKPEWGELHWHWQNLEKIRQGEDKDLTQEKVKGFEKLAKKLEERWQVFLLPDLDKD